MVGSPDPRDPKPDDPILPESAPLPELPELDPVPEDGDPEPDDVPYVPPPGTQ